MIVDSHQHFWTYGLPDYRWLDAPGLERLRRDFDPSDLEVHRRTCAIDATILVQAAASEAETRRMLATAASHGWIRGVVGWIDLRRTDAAARIAAFASDPLLRGIRPMLQDDPAPGWLLDPAGGAAFDMLITRGLAFDALIRTHQLPLLDAFAARWPDLPIILNHGAKPALAADPSVAWRTKIQALARHGNVACKLSGLVTEGGDRAPEAMATAIRVLADAFGPDRLLWGSDWPVQLLGGSYEAWAETARALVGAYLGPDAIGPVFGGNAARLYRLGAEPAGG